jgi:hypothetical protein
MDPDETGPPDGADAMSVPDALSQWREAERAADLLFIGHWTARPGAAGRVSGRITHDRGLVLLWPVPFL